jgi:hypothetical protein
MYHKRSFHTRPVLQPAGVQQEQLHTQLPDQQAGKRCIIAPTCNYQSLKTWKQRQQYQEHDLQTAPVHQQHSLTPSQQQAYKLQLMLCTKCWGQPNL